MCYSANIDINSSIKPWFLQINYPSPHEPQVVSRSVMNKFYDETRIIDIKEPIGASFLQDQFLRTKMDSIKDWNKNDWINWSRAKKNKSQTTFYKDKLNISSKIKNMENMLQSFNLYLKYFLISRNYALEIEMLDVYFSEWIKYLNESNIIDDTIICIASDHGELLGYYNYYGKSRPYTASIQVPLICMYKYGIRPNTNVVNKPVALMDLFGTFLDYASSDHGVLNRCGFFVFLFFLFFFDCMSTLFFKTGDIFLFNDVCKYIYMLFGHKLSNAHVLYFDFHNTYIFKHQHKHKYKCECAKQNQ